MAIAKVNNSQPLREPHQEHDIQNTILSDHCDWLNISRFTTVYGVKATLMMTLNVFHSKGKHDYAGKKRNHQILYTTLLMTLIVFQPGI